MFFGVELIVVRRGSDYYICKLNRKREVMEKINDFNERINNGGRVYLTEVYEQLGFETGHLIEQKHCFWDKDGFHDRDSEMMLDFDDINLLENENAKLKQEIDKLVFENRSLKDDNMWLKNQLKRLISEINKTLNGCAFKENDE